MSLGPAFKKSHHPMLTIKQIIKLYQEGVDICFKRKPHPDRLKGEFDPASLEVIVYLPAQESEQDMGITVLHEFIHARNNSRHILAEIDSAIENEALETYKKRPYILELINQLYHKKVKR